MQVQGSGTCVACGRLRWLDLIVVGKGRMNVWKELGMTVRVRLSTKGHETKGRKGVGLSTNGQVTLMMGGNGDGGGGGG